MSEMTVARRLKQKKRGEFALIRRAPDEPYFGVQLSGNDPEEMAWAAALVESRGADLVDVNLGCPIVFFTRKGLGSALARHPNRVRRIVEAMTQATKVPITVKIRLGWDDKSRNYLTVARAAVDGGASAVFVHGRTRQARYTQSADWDAIGEVATAVSVPVVGNGDLLFPHEISAALLRSGCAGVMVARGVLIKPWLFREAAEHRDLDQSPDQRLALYARYVALGREHWGDDELGTQRLREFLVWHLGFWCRYAPRRADGTYPSMQQRDSLTPAAPLDALLARQDAAAHGYLADQLLAGTTPDLDLAPPASLAGRVDDDAAEAG